MCGIIGYVGNENATPILLDGLRRLEYRGYDSAGVAVFENDDVKIQRTEGKLSNLELALAESPIKGSFGIGHTRWATHGHPTETNAHPHRSGDIIVVHNGIIENYLELKDLLAADGQVFTSETDTEVICHLIDYHYQLNGKDTLNAIRESITKLKGSFAIVIMNAKERNRLYVAKRGSPLVVGETKDARFVASDIPALLPYTKDMLFLEDGDHAVLSSEGIELFDENGANIEREFQHVPWSPLMAEKGGYKHFMLKEIFEQPKIMQDIFTGRVSGARSTIVLDELKGLFDGNKARFDRISIVACGTSLHAAMIGKHMIESLARVPVSVDYASEFRYREPILDERTLVIPISQSGETADTLAAEKLAKERNCPVMAVCNVVGSSITRIADATLYIYAGPEIGVASTKAFTAQLVVLYIFALYLADKLNKIENDILKERVAELLTLPRLLKQALSLADDVMRIAKDISDASNILYIGRRLNFPVALEGALKLKEISYLHAEGFAAGELKHGPIALIEQGTPVVAVVPQDGTYDKILSNIEEVKARGAYTIAIASDQDESISSKVDEVIAVPKTSKYLTPIVAAIPMQLLAYYVADHKGTDVDQPRNLAKSVTVE
ncbi:MAG: glutamine--fructose-6-phosphate transaminase (isomerizing) [Deltaproteobacteria bacterium]|nr:glutamine--fructose-6-phosphate transaminase (isomerizing) [Deltaproteobacteria bacterium]